MIKIRKTFEIKSNLLGLLLALPKSVVRRTGMYTDYIINKAEIVITKDGEIVIRIKKEI